MKQEKQISRYLTAFFGVFFIGVLHGCAGVPKSEPVSVVLSPMHRYTSLKHKPQEVANVKPGDLAISQLKDNDGNEYWQYWDLEGKDYKVFTQTRINCKKKTDSERTRFSQTSIEKLQYADIQPIRYKKFVSCISEQGYKYIHGDGFLPDKFNMMLYRGVIRYGKYIPVRGEFYIVKKDAKYIDVLVHLRECRENILQTKSKGVKDGYYRGFISVSIEPFAVSMMECMKKFSFKVISKNQQANEPNDSGDTKKSKKKPARKTAPFKLEYKSY